jgi:hypothetical protein
MDSSKHKTMKRMEMEYIMTTEKPVDQVKAMEIVIMTVLLMIQITLSPMLTTGEVSLEDPV